MNYKFKSLLITFIKADPKNSGKHCCKLKGSGNECYVPGETTTTAPSYGCDAGEDIRLFGATNKNIDHVLDLCQWQCAEAGAGSKHPLECKRCDESKDNSGCHISKNSNHDSQYCCMTKPREGCNNCGKYCKCLPETTREERQQQYRSIFVAHFKKDEENFATCEGRCANIDYKCAKTGKSACCESQTGSTTGCRRLPMDKLIKGFTKESQCKKRCKSLTSQNGNNKFKCIGRVLSHNYSDNCQLIIVDNLYKICVKNP